MSNTDIRQWLRDNDHEVNARGPVNAAALAIYNEANGVDDGPVDGPGDLLAAPEFPDTGESTPQMGKASLKDKFLKRQPSKERAPAKRTGRRVSLEDGGGIVWTVLANVVGGAGLIPAARVMAFQAPVAGVVLDDALKGTFVDKALQPIARAADKGGDVGALILPPLLVGLIQKRPELYPQMYPVLRELMCRWYEVAGPALRKKQEREAKRTEEMGGVDIDALIAALFAPEPGEVEVPVEEPVNGDA